MILYDWWDLKSKKQHRSQIETMTKLFMSQQKRDHYDIDIVNTQRLTYFLKAVADERIEKGVGPFFQFYLSHLFKRMDMQFGDFRRIVYSCWIKDRQRSGSIAKETWQQLLQMYEKVLRQDTVDKHDLDIFENIETTFVDLPPFPEEYAVQIFNIER